MRVSSQKRLSPKRHKSRKASKAEYTPAQHIFSTSTDIGFKSGVHFLLGNIIEGKLVLLLKQDPDVNAAYLGKRDYCEAAAAGSACQVLHAAEKHEGSQKPIQALTFTFRFPYLPAVRRVSITKTAVLSKFAESTFPGY